MEMVKLKKTIKQTLSLFITMAILCTFVPILPVSAATINIGDYVQMGTYYGQPILWRCVDIDANGPLMLSDKIICLKPFDAETSSNTTTGSHSRNSYRQSYGSNYWGDSNMRSWLNSSASAGNVNWLCGNPPIDSEVYYNAYDQEAGFLTNFTQEELNAVKSVTQKSLLSYPEIDAGMATTGMEKHSYNYNINNVVANYDTAYAEYVTDKMFLLDVKQVNAVYNNRSVLGDDYYIGEPTAECVANSEDKSSLSTGKKWYYWPRSPYSRNYYGVRCVASDGNVSNGYAYNGNVGVRPAFYLNLPSFSITSGAGTESNPYICYGSGGGGNSGNANSGSTSEGAPSITSAKITYGGNTYDLFADKLNVKKDSGDTYGIECSVNANGCTDVHIYLTQGASSATEIPLNTGKNIKIGKSFSVGQPIYVTAIDKKTGKSTSRRTKLSVVNDGMFEGSLSGGAINIIENFSVDVPDSVPVLGEQSFGLSLGSVSSEVEIDGNEFKVSVGTDFLEGKKGSDGKWKKEDWEGFKKGFKSAKENMRSGANGYKYLKNIAPKGTNMEMSKGVGGTANVTGYIEGYIDDTGVHPTEGGIIVSAEIKYTYKGMVVVVVVPLYYEIGAGGELTFVGGVKDLVPGNGLQGVWTGSITPAVFFEVGGGVGVPYIFTVGASGKVKAELEIALNKVYQKLDITGTAKFKLTGPLGIPTYEKPFAEGTFHVYETGNKNTLLGKVGLFSVDKAYDNPYSSIDIDAPITLTGHSKSVQTWVGDTENVELASVDYTNQDVKVLEENSYEGIAPVLSDMNGKNVIAWITDNKNRADGDKNMLVYSVEENGSWSAPVAVCDDGFADSAPSMKDGYIVWQKVASNITSDMSMRDLGKVCEIYLAKWNGNGFDTPVRITNNALLDQVPMLSVSGGKAAVVWVQNSDNNFMGTTGENRIMSYTDNTVKTEKTVSEAITNMSTSYIDGVLNIAYETDSDNDLSTLEDREIYNIANGSVSRITNNSAADTHPVYGEMNGDTVLFYYSDGKIVYNKNGAENTVIENNVTTDQFTVISNKVNTAVLWTTVQDGSAELHGALYDGSVWSEDVQVSDLGKRVKFPSAVMQSDGSIFAAFNRTEKVPNEYYYDDGQADLCTIKITPSYDLELTDVYFDEENMQVYATVKNNGERNIDSYTISLNDNGVNAQKTITEPLKAGESADVEIAYNKPDDLSSRKVTLSVSLISGEEYDVDNNSAEFSIGNPDVAVSNVVINEDETKVTADVSNIGYSIANDVTVSLREGSSSGTVLEKQTVTLSANESNSVEFDINKDNIHFYKPSTQLYITAEYASDEVSLGNNDGYVIVMSKSGMANYQTEILNYSEIDNQYVVNSVAANNTDEDIKCILYSAVYSENGMLKGCGKVDADIDANCETGVDIFVSCRIEDGDIIRTFMWTENMGALANISELIATE